MKSTDNIGSYRISRFPKYRDLLGNLASLSPKYPVQALVEVDVTEARTLIRNHKEKTGESVSFTAWLITCIARAVSEHKQVQAYRRGKRLIVFDDVDVGFAMERQGQPAGGRTIVIGAIVRKANEKTLRQLNAEIRAAQTEKVMNGPIVGKEVEARLASFFQSMPGAVRRLAVWWYRRDPFFRKRTQGTVGMTSIGNVLGVSSGMSAFPVTSGPFPLYFVVGGVSKKPGVVDDEGIEVREYLPMCVIFDHDVVDGADAARFLASFTELLKAGYGLVEEDTRKEHIPAG